jgi:hypothetical protein
MNIEQDFLISGAHRKRGVIICNSGSVKERLTGIQSYHNSHLHGLGTFILDAILDRTVASGIFITTAKD